MIVITRATKVIPLLLLKLFLIWFFINIKSSFSFVFSSFFLNLFVMYVCIIPNFANSIHLLHLFTKVFDFQCSCFTIRLVANNIHFYYTIYIFFLQVLFWFLSFFWFFCIFIFRILVFLSYKLYIINMCY